MDSEAEELYLQKIEELVQDEDSIVTCSLLARNLKISLNDSKNLLAKYVQDQRRKKPDYLGVTYLISGKLKDDGSSIHLIKESNLENIKALYEKVTSEVLYSVQKNRTLDLNAIALAEKINPENIYNKPLKSSIVGKNCIVRKLKLKNLPAPPAQKIIDKAKPSSFFKIQPKLECEEKLQKEVPKAPVKEEKKKGIASFFGKNATTKSDSNEKTREVSNGNLKDSMSKKELPEANLSDIKEPEKATVKKTELIKLEDKMEIKQMVETDESSRVEKTETKNNRKSKSGSAKEKKKSRGVSKESSSQKKRKRIVMHDSDSDDMFANVEDDTLENSHISDDEPESIVHKPVITQTVKGKKRKAIDRTYKDEEGFIVTKTEYVFESASDDEPEVVKETMKEEQKPAKAPKIEKPTSDNISPPKQSNKGKKGKKGAPMGNQPTLMQFFKKN